jgi:thiol-disulfide isomerase/thioredoxin
MKTLTSLLFAFVLATTVFSQSNNIAMVDFKGLSPMLTNNSDTVVVVNFWATWCKPCVEELPVFTKLSRDMKQQKVKFLFVSLDFPKQVESRLIPFVTNNLSDQKVVLLNDPNANAWISKVDANWSGAIPATLIYKGSKRLFHEGTMNEEQLVKAIENIKAR